MRGCLHCQKPRVSVLKIQAIRWKCRVAAYWIPLHPTEISSTDRHITVTGMYWNKEKRTAALSKTTKEETALFSFIVASVFSFFFLQFQFSPLDSIQYYPTSSGMCLFSLLFLILFLPFHIPFVYTKPTYHNQSVLLTFSYIWKS